jgi:hypothetical protein
VVVNGVCVPECGADGFPFSDAWTSDRFAPIAEPASPHQPYWQYVATEILNLKDGSMTERLVDVSDAKRIVLHTYPIALGRTEAGSVAPDAEYESKALSAAAHAQLVPDAELLTLSSRMHVSRRGSLEPYGDSQEVLSETKQGLEQAVRERAYSLWEMDGCPPGHADDYWHRARDQHLRERAHVLWRQEGCPIGRADEHWRRVQAFEAD